MLMCVIVLKYEDCPRETCFPYTYIEGTIEDERWWMEPNEINVRQIFACCANTLITIQFARTLGTRMYDGQILSVIGGTISIL